MVLKLIPDRRAYGLKFENDVKMYGTQTLWNAQSNRYMFENDVKMYGTQTTSGGYRNSAMV